MWAKVQHLWRPSPGPRDGPNPALPRPAPPAALCACQLALMKKFNLIRKRLPASDGGFSPRPAHRTRRRRHTRRDGETYIQCPSSSCRSLPSCPVLPYPSKVQVRCPRRFDVADWHHPSSHAGYVYVWQNSRWIGLDWAQCGEEVPTASSRSPRPRPCRVDHIGDSQNPWRWRGQARGRPHLPAPATMRPCMHDEGPATGNDTNCHQNQPDLTNGSRKRVVSRRLTATWDQMLPHRALPLLCPLSCTNHLATNFTVSVLGPLVY